MSTEHYDQWEELLLDIEQEYYEAEANGEPFTEDLDDYILNVYVNGRYVKGWEAEESKWNIPVKE